MTLVVNLAKAFEKVQLSVVPHWALHTGFPQRMLRVVCVYFALSLLSCLDLSGPFCF